ncbi:MAG: tetratricopeptide repeat protein, partial [Vicingaceae bacterium]|nr:tetratricopeptide repeat protein [Vicingaceae bacterium]
KMNKPLLSMRRSAILLISCILFNTSIFSQENFLDSLIQELSLHKEKDTVRVKILNQLAFVNYSNDPPQSIIYVEEAMKLADEIKSVKGKARSFYLKGVIYLEQANFKVAIENIEKAVELYSSLDDLSGIAKCSNAFGVLYYYKGNSKQALKHYKEALNLKEKLGDENNEGLIYNIGNVYSDMGEYQKALINFEKVLDIYRKKNDEQGVLSCLNSIATVYYEQGNYPLSLKYYNESLQVSENISDSIGMFRSLNNLGNLYRQQDLNDKALSFYNRALAIQAAKYNVKNITALKNNIGGIYYEKEEFNTAINYYNESIALCREIDDNANLSSGLNGLGFVYFETKEYSKALTYFKEACEITLLNNDPYDLLDAYHGMTDSYFGMKKYDLALVNAKKLAQLSAEYGLLRHEKNAYALLSDIYEKTGSYKKALESHQQYQLLNDSLFNKANVEKIAQLEAEYKYKQALDSANIKELQLVKTVMTTSQDLEKSEQKILLGVAGFLIVALILGIIIFLLKLKNVKSEAQNIAIEQKLLRSQMTPHFIFNSLSVLQGMILNKEEKKAVSYLSKFSKLLRIILENSRDKTVSLNQELTAVENYLTLQNIEETKAFKYTVEVDNGIDKSQFKIPPMLIQPFIENAIEHAFEGQIGNKKIDIHLSYIDEKLICTINDNGIGVDAQKTHQSQDKKSLATTITSERLDILSKDFNMKGSVRVEDKKKKNEKGTLVTLVIPYKIQAA